MTVLHLPRKKEHGFSAADTQNILKALDRVPGDMPNLRVLGVSLNLLSDIMHVLASICSVMRNQLQGVSIPMHGWHIGGHSLVSKQVFFEAVGKLRKWKMLLFPQWKKFVGKDVSVLEPL